MELHWEWEIRWLVIWFRRKYGNHYSEYANMDSHNWTDDMLRTASAQNHNVTINGGSENENIIFC